MRKSGFWASLIVASLAAGLSPVYAESTEFTADVTDVVCSSDGQEDSTSENDEMLSDGIDMPEGEIIEDNTNTEASQIVEEGENLQGSPEMNSGNDLFIEEEAEEVVNAADNGITVNSEDVSLYYLGGYYTDYIKSIPDDLPVSFQIKVYGTDKIPQYVASGSGVEVDENGLITLSSASNIYHEPTGYIKVKIDGNLAARIAVHQISYESYYAKSKVNEDINRLGIKNLSNDYDKVEAICKYISTTYNYDAHYASMTGEVITGGADCWGNSDLVQYMCEQCGIPAHIRNANFEPGAGAGHENDIVKIGSDYYIVDCGYTGNAPRYYVFAKSNDDFEYKILVDRK